MCGIFAYHGPRDDAAKQTLLALKKLEYRGYDSWGIALRNKDNTIEIEKHTGKITQKESTLSAGYQAIGHTRWATHGEVTETNAHPHLSQSGNVAIVHNGIVENYRELKARLNKKGYIFKSETDSELIAHLIEEHTKTKPFAKAVMKTMLEIVGSNAILALNGKNGDIVACRDGSPLIAGIGKHECIIASDVVAITPYTDQCVYLQDEETILFTGKDVACFDTKSGRQITYTTETINIRKQEIEKNGYDHYMLKEIVDQAQTIPRAYGIGTKRKSEIMNLISDREIVFTGCGTAFNCCIVGTYLASEQGVRARAIPANEFSAFEKTFNENTAVIAISQSGETIDTIEAIKTAKNKGSKIVSILNVPHSSLARISDISIDIDAGPEVAVVSTKAFTAQATVLFSLFSTHIQIHDISSWIVNVGLKTAYEIAQKIQNAHGIFIIGKHVCYPIALESALKIKEASYIHAEGFAAGELKHGVIALIEKGTPCIVLDDGKNVTDLTSSAIQLKSRGGYIIGISEKPNEVYDEWFTLPQKGIEPFLTIAIAGQLLGYTLSLSRGSDPDKPRNLAKSVTVK